MATSFLPFPSSVLIILSLSAITITLGRSEPPPPPCGINFEYGSRTQTVPLEDGQDIIDFHSYLGASTHSAASSRSSSGISFQARRSCSLHFTHDPPHPAQTYSGPLQNLRFEWVSPRSVSCSCKKTKSCSCESVHLPAGECARVFLAEDCSRCDANFLLVLDTAGTREQSRWDGTISAVVLAPRCHLHLSVGRSRARPLTLSSQRQLVYKDLQRHGKIRDWACTCDARPRATTQPTTTEPPTSTTPEPPCKTTPTPTTTVPTTTTTTTPPPTTTSTTPATTTTSTTTTTTTTPPPTTTSSTTAPVIITPPPTPPPTTSPPPPTFPQTQVWELLERSYSLRNYTCSTQVYLELQYALYLRNITTTSDFTTMSSDLLIKLLIELEVTVQIWTLLKTAFHLELPVFTGDKFVGSGYSLMEDKVFDSSLVRFGGYTEDFDLLLRFPDAYLVEEKSERRQCWRLFNSQRSLEDARFLELGISPDLLATTREERNVSFTECLSCFNLFSPTPPAGAPLSLSKTYEYTHFVIELNPKAKPSPAFLRELKELRPWNESDPVGIYLWNKFFSTWGTHVVSRAKAGGSITLTVEMEVVRQGGGDSSYSQSDLGILSQALGEAALWIEQRILGKDNHTKLEGVPGLTYKLSMTGGDPQFFPPSFAQLENLPKWKESFAWAPAILRTTAQLIPISDFIRRHYVPTSANASILSSWIDEAVRMRLNPQQQTATPSPPPPTVEATTSVPEGEAASCCLNKTVLLHILAELKELNEQLNKLERRFYTTDIEAQVPPERLTEKLEELQAQLNNNNTTGAGSTTTTGKPIQRLLSMTLVGLEGEARNEWSRLERVKLWQEVAGEVQAILEVVEHVHSELRWELYRTCNALIGYCQCSPKKAGEAEAFEEDRKAFVHAVLSLIESLILEGPGPDDDEPAPEPSSTGTEEVEPEESLSNESEAIITTTPLPEEEEEKVSLERSEEGVAGVDETEWLVPTKQPLGSETTVKQGNHDCAPDDGQCWLRKGQQPK